MGKKWIVASLKGDRAVIDKSTDGKSSICSPINTKYLIPDGVIAVGSVVSIAKGAVYYSGSKVPDWVQKKKWVVKSIKGDRVVIDKSADGKNAICSPINLKYLFLK
jgi:signal peptidase I